MVQYHVCEFPKHGSTKYVFSLVCIYVRKKIHTTKASGLEGYKLHLWGVVAQVEGKEEMQKSREPR